MDNRKTEVRNKDEEDVARSGRGQRRSYMWVGATVAASLLLAACSSANTPQGADETSPEAQAADSTEGDGNAATCTDGPITIGATMPLSGVVAPDGENTVNGMRMAVSEINEAGGVLGQTLELEVLDDQATPEEGVSAVQRLLSQDVNALATALNSSVGLAQIEASKDQALHVIVLASAPDITDVGYDNVFRVNTTSTSKEEQLITFAEERVEKVAMLFTNDDYGHGLAELYEQRWSDSGPEIALQDFFQGEDTDFSPYLSRVQNADVDGLYVAAQAVQLTGIFEQAQDMGIDVDTRWTVGASLNPTVIELAPASVEGLVSSDIFVATSDAAAEFTSAYEAEHGKQPSNYEAAGYDAINTVAHAMETAGTACRDDWQSMADALSEATLEGPRGEYSFDENGQVVMPAVLVEIQDGEIVVME